jgi:hypothetical protein
MTHDDAARTFCLAARDLVAVVAARESFGRSLAEFVRRRAPRYADPDGVPAGDDYWTDLAATLAPVLPSEHMPMWGLIDADLTLEGGAKGLRSLFSSTPSERERRKVQRTATLAWRVMSIVAHTDAAVTADEARLMNMAMSSFGLTADELAAARADGPSRAAQLEVFGELDGRVRRELVRGAWQLALQVDLGAGEEDEVLTIAAKLEFSSELGAVRREVEGALERAARVAGLAVELGLAAGASLSAAQRDEALDRIIAAAAPPRAAVALRTRARGESPAPSPKSLALVGAQRTQALAMAWSSLRALDLHASAETLLRADLRAAATRFEADADAGHAMELVDRYLLERVAERGAVACGA